MVTISGWGPNLTYIPKGLRHQHNLGVWDLEFGVSVKARAKELGLGFRGLVFRVYGLQEPEFVSCRLPLNPKPWVWGFLKSGGPVRDPEPHKGPLIMGQFRV